MSLKLNLLLCLLLVAVHVAAEEVSASKLSSVTFDGDQVVLHYNDGTPDASFDLEAVTIHIPEAASVEGCHTAKSHAALEGKKVYNLNGQYMGNSTAHLPKGVYVIDKAILIKN